MAPYFGLALTFVLSIVGAAWYLRGLIADSKAAVLEAVGEQGERLARVETKHEALKERVERIENKVNQ